MCDTFVILPDNTQSGSLFFAKNSDREPNEPQLIEVISAQDHPVGSILKCTYVSIPQVDHTYAVLLSKPSWIWGAEMGINEFGVVIGNEAVFSKVKAQKEPGIIGMDYLRLGLERAENANGALRVITNLLEEYGQGGNCGFSHPFYYHNSYLIADRNEAWKLETVGKQWAAQKIKKFGAISNALTIESDWDLHSDNLMDFAVENRLYPLDDVENSRFNFSNVYSDWLYTRFSNASSRRSCVLTQLSQLSKEFGIGDIFKILRTHHGNEDTFSPDKGITGSDVCMHAGFGPIRASQSTGSMVVEISNGFPKVWVTGSSAACLSIFLPVSIFHPTSLFEVIPDKTFDGKSLWWRHELIHRRIIKNYQSLKDEYQLERDEIEKQFINQTNGITNDHDIAEFSVKASEIVENFLERWINLTAEKDSHSHNRFLYKSAWNGFNKSARITL